MDELVAYNCDPNTEYNEVASLFLSDADTAIRQVWKAFRIGMVIRGMAIRGGVPSDWSCGRRPCCCSSSRTGRATDIPRTYCCGRDLPFLTAPFTARVGTVPITTRCVLPQKSIHNRDDMPGGRIFRESFDKNPCSGSGSRQPFKLFTVTHAAKQMPAIESDIMHFLHAFPLRCRAPLLSSPRHRAWSTMSAAAFPLPRVRSPRDLHVLVRRAVRVLRAVHHHGLPHVRDGRAERSVRAVASVRGSLR